jgi:hypothetical protein
LSFDNKDQEMLVAETQKYQRIRELDISNDYKVYISKIQIEGDSTSFEEAVRGVHSSK